MLDRPITQYIPRGWVEEIVGFAIKDLYKSSNGIIHLVLCVP
jgi:hypothetical protein